MNKNYVVIMYENFTDVVAERTYTNKDAAFEMAEWYMSRRYEQTHGKYAYPVIKRAKKLLRENGKIPFIVTVKESWKTLFSFFDISHC